MSTPSSIAQALVTALQTLPITPALTANTCYAIAAPAYIEGQDQLVLLFEALHFRQRQLQHSRFWLGQQTAQTVILGGFVSL